MGQIIDAMIAGISLAIVIGIITKIFNLKDIFTLILFVGLFVILFFTDIGKDIRSKLAIFDKSDSWTITGVRTVANQCGYFTFYNVNIKDYTGAEAEAKVKCCTKNIISNNSQDDYMKLQSTFVIISDSIYKCNK